MVLVGAASNARLLAPLRDRTGDGPSVAERVEEWVAQRRESRGGWPALVAVRSVRRATEVRITGLAAEMSYYALISLVPLLTALGASLGSLERVLGTAAEIGRASCRERKARCERAEVTKRDIVTAHIRTDST